MPDSGPKIRGDNSTSIVIVTGQFNSSPSVRPGEYRSYSYTVREVIEMVDGESLGAQSRPLNPGAVRALNSVVRSRVPESAILRDTSGEL